MLARSVRNPLIIGVGTGLVLVSGTAPAALAATTPSPTPSSSASTKAPSKPPSATPTKTSSKPSATPTPTTSTTPPSPTDPTLGLAFRHAPSSLTQGKTVSMYLAVTPTIPKGGKPPANVQLHVGSAQANVTFASGGKHTFAIKSLSFAKLLPINVAVPGNLAKGKVTVWAQADADNTPQTNAKPSLSLSVKAKPKPTPTKPNGSGGGSGSGGSSGSSGGSSGTSLPTGSSGSLPSATPSSTAAVLPPITTPQQQTPATAPGPNVRNTSNSQSMRGTAADSDELTFDKLASTQAAWLAALLVAFSLLLTQIRLGRTATTTTTTKDAKQKGAHRRPRRPGNAH